MNDKSDQKADVPSADWHVNPSGSTAADHSSPYLSPFEREQMDAIREQAMGQIAQQQQNALMAPATFRWPAQSRSAAIAEAHEKARALVQVSEIPVTQEMISAGRDAWLSSIEIESGRTTFETIYRAMAAVAPVELVSNAELRAAKLQSADDDYDYLHEEVCDLNEELGKAQTRITALEAANTALVADLEASRARERHTRQELREQSARMEELQADLEKAREDIKFWVAMEELQADLEKGAAQVNSSVAFGDPTPSDLPDPPRRADGTLLPQPKPLPVLKPSAPSQRVGG